MPTVELKPGVEVMSSPSALQAIVSGEIDLQIRTAKAYPRSIPQAVKKTLELATLPQVAKEMNYAIPRGGKIIEGPSVRLAEILASQWGNLRTGSRLISMDETGVTCQGVAHDLETNWATTMDVFRRYPVKPGQKASPDMMALTAMACSKIAKRDAIFEVISKPFWEPIAEAAKKASLGSKPEDVAPRLERALDFFEKAGVTEAQVLQRLGKAKRGEVTPEDLSTLHGFAVSMKEGAAIEEIFEPPNIPSEVIFEEFAAPSRALWIKRCEEKAKEVKKTLADGWKDFSEDELEALYQELSK